MVITPEQIAGFVHAALDLGFEDFFMAEQRALVIPMEDGTYYAPEFVEHPQDNVIRFFLVKFGEDKKEVPGSSVTFEVTVRQVS